MTDPEEIEARRAQYLRLREQLHLPAVQARMVKDGLDPATEIQKLDDMWTKLAGSMQRVDEGEENLLQATADRADALRELYRGLKALVEEKEREDPLHPGLEEARDFLEALEEEMPKDLE